MEDVTDRVTDPDATADVVVEGTYELGMQDQAFLGLEAALAIPDDDRSGIDYMKRLYQYAYNAARSGYHWEIAPPGFEN